MGVITPGIYDVHVDVASCKACGLCSAFCPQDVLVPDAEGIPQTPGLAHCIGCKLCEWHCPDWAIEITAIEITAIEITAIENVATGSEAAGV